MLRVRVIASLVFAFAWCSAIFTLIIILSVSYNYKLAAYTGLGQIMSVSESSERIVVSTGSALSRESIVDDRRSVRLAGNMFSSPSNLSEENAWETHLSEQMYQSRPTRLRRQLQKFANGIVPLGPRVRDTLPLMGFIPLRATNTKIRTYNHHTSRKYGINGTSVLLLAATTVCKNSSKLQVNRSISVETRPRYQNKDVDSLFNFKRLCRQGANLTTSGFDEQRNKGLYTNQYDVLNVEKPTVFNNQDNVSEVPVCLYITHQPNPGRLGNKMFIYAAMFGIYHRLGLIPACSSYNDGLHDIRTIFHVPTLNKTIYFQNMTRFFDKSPMTYNEKILTLSSCRNYTLVGYFQSWKYFRTSFAEIRREFTFIDPVLKVAHSFHVSLGHTAPVCIHVRRGDFNFGFRRGYIPTDSRFVYRAMAYFKMKYPSKMFLFVVVSDDISWCKRHFLRHDIIFSENHTAAEDMAILSLCPYNVVTSGTFGWWGAFLSQGETVYWKQFPRPGSWLDSMCRTEDYFLPEWTGLW